MDLDSDSLYMLATGVSILSILAVFVFKLCFGGGKKKEKVGDENNKPIVRGCFGQFPPMSEWRQHKLALEQEYKDRFMEKTIVNERDGEKTSKTKVVRFLQNTTDDDDSADQPIEAEIEAEEVDGDDDRNSATDDSVEDALNEEVLDEATLEHLPAHLKTAKLRTYTKEVEKDLTDEQKQEEANIRCQQLESIFNLMREQEEKFGVSSMEDIEEQLKLYSF